MILVIMGPTGVGKTKLSIALAKRYQGEIINADSMQVYQGLDIGTAKVKEEEKEGILHHLFDICKVEDTYTVYDYQKDARLCIQKIQEKGNHCIFVGGTGLYIKAALFQYQFQEGTTHHTYDSFSNLELLEKIKKYPIKELPHVNNRKRLVRLLNKLENHEEVSKNGNTLCYQDVLFLYLKAPRKLLYEKLDARVEEMFKEGLLEEVTSYQKMFPNSKALQTGIGYKEFIPYFNKEQTLEEVKETIKKNTRHYAKRQETFFQNQFPKLHVITPNYENFEKTIEEACLLVEKELQDS